MSTKGITQARQGKGIGFKVNVLVTIGVTLMVAILVSFIAYVSFNALVDAGKREKMLENQQIAAQIEQRYNRVIRIAPRIKKTILDQFSLASDARDRERLVSLLQDEMRESKGIAGLGISLEPMVYDGKDTQLQGQGYNDATGRVSVYVGKDGKPIVLNNDGQRNWYNDVKNKRQPFLTEPYRTPGGRLVARYSLPIEQNGQFIGVVVADIDLNDIQQYIEKISTPEVFYAVFTRGGTFIAHGRNKEYVLKHFYDTFPMTDAEIKDAFDETSITHIDRTSPTTGEMTVYTFCPMHLEGVSAEWSVVAASNKAVFTAVARKMVWTSVGIALICGILLIAVMAFFIRKQVTDPVGILTGVIQRLAKLDIRTEGEKAKILCARGDEIGTISRSLVTL